MKKLGILAVMAVMITGFLTLSAGTAHAGWSLVQTCTVDNVTYKLKKQTRVDSTFYGVRKCSGGNCSWLGKNLSESDARNLAPCM
jgi:hypothetical protein